MQKLLIFVVVAFAVTSCNNTIYGMPEDEFNSLSPEQQEQVVLYYNRKKEIEASRRDTLNVLTNAIGGVGGISGGRSSSKTETSPMVCRWEGGKRVCTQSQKSKSSGFGWSIGR